MGGTACVPVARTDPVQTDKYYIETPSRPRVNWKSVLPASNSLGTYAREATAAIVSSICSVQPDGSPSRSTSRSSACFSNVSGSEEACTSGIIRCACILVLEIFGTIQGTGKPVLYLGDHAVYATVELDARPPKAIRVEVCLFEAVPEVVVVGLLAAVLQGKAEPDGGAGEVAEYGAGVDGLGRAGGDAAALCVGQCDDAGYFALSSAAIAQTVGYTA